MFTATLHADAIRRSPSGGPAMLLAFLDVVATFVLPNRSDINLLIS